MKTAERALLDPSPNILLAQQLARLGSEGAHRAVDALLDSFSVVELAALAADWSFWARPKQRAPAGEWVSWGFLTARGLGKTEGIANHITEEVHAGRAMSIGLAAQTELKTIEVQVGSLRKVAPPWFQPTWRPSIGCLLWPNGAVAFVRTPEVPGAIRSENHHLAWLSEVQSWPAETREEAYLNFVFATRVGYARTIWDATPKRGHPILKRLLKLSVEDPARYVIVRGTIYENPWLALSALRKMELEYAGTRAGREELLGEMLEESENALVKQSWIDEARRDAPDEVLLRVISVDPAITARAGSDRTGLVDVGLGVDRQMLVLGDHSGKYKPDEWGAIVLDLYVRGGCHLVLVETNRGGDLVTSNLRAAAAKRGLRVVVIGKADPVPPRCSGVVYVREVHARGTKETRATPLATAYERRRVSHIRGVDLTALEDTLTTWEPAAGMRSPDPLDALAHAAIELLGLLDNTPDPKVAFDGIELAASRLTGRAMAGGVDLASLQSGRGLGRRI